MVSAACSILQVLACVICVYRLVLRHTKHGQYTSTGKLFPHVGGARCRVLLHQASFAMGSYIDSRQHWTACLWPELFPSFHHNSHAISCSSTAPEHHAMLLKQLKKIVCKRRPAKLTDHNISSVFATDLPLACFREAFSNSSERLSFETEFRAHTQERRPCLPVLSGAMALVAPSLPGHVIDLLVSCPRSLALARSLSLFFGFFLNNSHNACIICRARDD